MVKKTNLSSWTLGIPDSEFFQRYPQKGLITKVEVRVITLAKLNLRETSVLWDIGAGSGSVAIEASRLAKRGKVFAIEKTPSDIKNIEINIGKFNAKNVEVIPAYAPDKLDLLPDPDAVFIGGSSGRLEEVLEKVCRRLVPHGRLVMNAASVENLSTALKVLKKNKWQKEITMVMIARSKTTGALTRFESLNPVFILSAWKLPLKAAKKGGG